MADGLCSGSDRKAFVASSMNENVIKSCEKLEKCMKLSTENSDEWATAKSVCAETQKTGLKRDHKMTGTKQQQQQQKSMDTKISNKSASGAAMVVVTGTAIKSNNGRAETIMQQHSKKKNVGLQGSGGGSVQKTNSKTGSGVNSTAPGAATEAATLDPAEGGDDSPSTKKKRCSDRYDSSESSDSGVATLSCTDSSTASSDASDPGSPYSPVSLGEDAHQSSKANMPPQIVPITQNHHHHQHHHQQQQQTTTTVQHQWPWNASSNNTLSNHNNNNINASNKNSSVNSVLSSGKNKRISVNPSDTNGTAKKVRTSTSAERLSSGVSAAANKRLKVQQEESQTKITGFFKSQMKPLKVIKSDINTLVPSSADKYFNILAGKGAASAKDDKDRKTIAIKKDFEIIDLPPLQTMSPSLRRIEPKPAKVEQVAPISRKTSASQQTKPPKKHIAIAPRTAGSAKNPPNQLRKPPTTTFQIDQAKISQPTVLLTAIRIPQQGNGHQQQLTATAVQQHNQQRKSGSTSTKVGSMFQIPVMPNLVQIPNILTTANGTNLVMNNGQLARMGTGAQYFLNGTVLKLQQISNGHTGSASSANGVLTMDTSTLQGNILVKPPNAIGQAIPLAAVSSAPKGTLALQQPIVTQSSINGNGGCHQSFLGSQRISANQVLMATASGWYVVNQPADAVSNNIPHPAALSTMVCKTTRTVTSLTGTMNPPVPPLVTLASKHETISSNAGTKFLNSNKLPTHLSVDVKEHTTAFADSTKLLSVDVAFTKLKNEPIENNFHLKIPTIIEPPTASLSSLSPKEAIISMKSCLPSPKSLILEQIQQKTTPFVFTNNHDNSSFENSLKIECSAITTATASTVIKSEPFADLLPALKALSAPTINTCEIQDTLLPKCAISPILSQPKTIRFPVPAGCKAGFRFGPKGPRRHDGVCYWDKCSAKYDTSSKLLDHLQTQHVNTQTGPFSCLWSGCKVRGRESCSRRWLERHVLSHGGTKPFKCIVDGCGLRFGSQLALQKHVNGHFTTIETKDNPNKRTSDPPVPKLLRKNGKKLRYRRQPFSARMFDYFDAGIMEGLQHRLIVTGSLANGVKGSVTFQGRTIARRKTKSGMTELFVKWSPHEILPDEWIPETTKTNILTKTVTIQSMRCQERCALQKYLGAANLKSDIIHNSVSKSQLFPSIAATMTALCSNNKCSSSSSDSSSSSNSSTTTTSTNDTKTCGRKQSRKPPKRNQIQPS